MPLRRKGSDRLVRSNRGRSPQAADLAGSPTPGSPARLVARLEGGLLWLCVFWYWLSGSYPEIVALLAARVGITDILTDAGTEADLWMSHCGRWEGLLLVVTPVLAYLVAARCSLRVLLAALLLLPLLATGVLVMCFRLSAAIWPGALLSANQFSVLFLSCAAGHLWGAEHVWTKLRPPQRQLGTGLGGE